MRFKYFLLLSLLVFALYLGLNYHHGDGENQAPPGSENDKNLHLLADHLEKNPQLLVDIRKASPNFLEKTKIEGAPLLFSHDFVDQIESVKVKERLIALNQTASKEQAKQLIDEINGGVGDVDSSKTEEKFRLMQIYFYVDAQYDLKSSPDFYLRLADENINSDNLDKNNLGENSLEYYLNFYTDLETRNQKKLEFLGDHKNAAAAPARSTSRNPSPPESSDSVGSQPDPQTASPLANDSTGS